MILGLVTHGRDRQRDREGQSKKVAGLTQDDLLRIRSVAETPRHRRTPDMLRPDEDDATDE